MRTARSCGSAATALLMPLLRPLKVRSLQDTRGNSHISNCDMTQHVHVAAQVDNDVPVAVATRRMHSLDTPYSRPRVRNVSPLATRAPTVGQSSGGIPRRS